MINMTEESPTMRLQLALNVSDLEKSVEFYTKMFGTAPVRERPGYANFAIANPPLKLVLFEGVEDGTINHLGVETSTALEVSEAEARLLAEGLETTGVEDTICCYAEKTETWLQGPDSTRWEWYVRTGDAEQMVNTVKDSPEGCCDVGDEGTAPTTDASAGPTVCCG